MKPFTIKAFGGTGLIPAGSQKGRFIDEVTFFNFDAILASHRRGLVLQHRASRF